MSTSPHNLLRPISKTAELQYLLHLPDGYAESPAPWPLILHLHGAGERGDDLEKVRAVLTKALEKVTGENLTRDALRKGEALAVVFKRFGIL